MSESSKKLSVSEQRKRARDWAEEQKLKKKVTKVKDVASSEQGDLTPVSQRKSQVSSISSIDRAVGTQGLQHILLTDQNSSQRIDTRLSKRNLSSSRLSEAGSVAHDDVESTSGSLTPKRLGRKKQNAQVTEDSTSNRSSRNEPFSDHQEEKEESTTVRMPRSRRSSTKLKTDSTEATIPIEMATTESVHEWPELSLEGVSAPSSLPTTEEESTRYQIIKKLSDMTKKLLREKNGPYPIAFLAEDILEEFVDKKLYVSSLFAPLDHWLMRNRFSALLGFFHRAKDTSAASKTTTSQGNGNGNEQGLSSVGQEQKTQVEAEVDVDLAPVRLIWPAVVKSVGDDIRIQTGVHIYEGKSHKCWRFLGTSQSSPFNRARRNSNGNFNGNGNGTENNEEESNRPFVAVTGTR
eukprot:gene1770-3430_t